MQQSATEQHKTTKDSLLTAMAVILFLGGFYLAGSFMLAGQPWFVRLGVVIISLVVSMAALWPTSHRERIISLVRGARIEMRKVHWPVKDEVVKTTLMVLAIVTVFAIFLSIIDWILVKIVGWLL